MDEFIEHLRSYLELVPSDRDLIREVLYIREFNKREMILSEGEISKEFFFNLQGFIRLFYNNDDGERTAYFYPKGTFVSAYESFVRQTPSQLNLQATENTRLVVITLEASMKLLQHSSRFEVLARIAMEDELIAHQKIIQSLLTLTPEQRYDALLNDNPSIFQKVPQHQIASYLGVKPESLSRIKKRLHERKS